MGKEIPEYIGICGPENWDWQTDMIWPVIIELNITTFSIYTKDMEKQPASLLLNMIENPEKPPEEIFIPTELRVGNLLSEFRNRSVGSFSLSLVHA